MDLRGLKLVLSALEVHERARLGDRETKADQDRLETLAREKLGLVYRVFGALFCVVRFVRGVLVCGADDCGGELRDATCVVRDLHLAAGRGARDGVGHRRVSALERLGRPHAREFVFLRGVHRDASLGVRTCGSRCLLYEHPERREHVVLRRERHRVSVEVPHDG